MGGAEWKAQIDTRHPCWQGYTRLLEAVNTADFPRIADLNALLPPVAVNHAGKPIRFVPAGRLPGVDYEEHIFKTGEVSTRERNWHDLFNALVWCRWPALKAAMNAMHRLHARSSREGKRGKVRDALTLFDECGVIVFSSDQNVLRQFARRDWAAVFGSRPEFGVRITGHALLEKFTAPYKAITAHAVLLALDPASCGPAAEIPTRFLDEAVAGLLLEGRLFMAPAHLSPLPLMGLAGWWKEPQDAAFYADRSVFRPPRPGLNPAPVFRLPQPLPGL
jgi:hypothetical protein